MFARAARREGTPQYEAYYRWRSELKAGDDRLRALPPLLVPGGRYFDREVCAEAGSFFEAIDGIRPDPGAVERWAGELASTGDPKAYLLRLCSELGAVASGVTNADEAYVYTHKGRFDQVYGREIHLPHRFVLVFLVEMDFEAMQRAPRADVIRESARQYYRAAEISLTLEAVMLRLGVGAKAHYDAHYDVILPPLAMAAGLGEVGRNNILIADRFGSRVRIGAVTTDLLLAPDEPVFLGVGRFCEVCRKCATSCPSKALSLGASEIVSGVARWPTAVERCYGYWRTVGTDCGVCMAVCPFSHRDNALHNGVRRIVRRFPRLHPVLVLGDDLVYGRRWKRGRMTGRRTVPDDMSERPTKINGGG